MKHLTDRTRESYNVSLNRGPFRYWLLPRYDSVYNLGFILFMIFAGYCMESSRVQSHGYHNGCSILWRQRTPIYRLPGHGCASDDGVCLPTAGRREQPMCTYVPTDAKRLLQEIPIGGTSDWIPSANSSATRLFPCWDRRKNDWKQTGCYGKHMAAVILIQVFDLIYTLL